MFKTIRKRLKDQRGLTLVELLAVIVILGIISAIAVPNIGGLIDKTKKDAHVANARQMAESARLAITTKDEDLGTPITLKSLIDDGYIENIKDPTSKVGYDPTKSTVTVSKNGNQYAYLVTLKSYDTTTGAAGGVITYLNEVNPYSDPAPTVNLTASESD